MRYSAMNEPVVSQGCCLAMTRIIWSVAGCLLILTMGMMLLAME